MAINQPPELRSVGEIVEAWCEGSITSAQAIDSGGFDDFAELLDFAVRSEVPLRTRLSEVEQRQAEFFTSLLTRR